jgi:hypothetical protein
MAYTLEVNHPDFPDDYEFDCDGILVKNKSSRKLTEEDELAFISRHAEGRTVKDIYGHGTYAKVTGTTELSGAEKKQATAIQEAREGGEN